MPWNVIGCDWFPWRRQAELDLLVDGYVLDVRPETALQARTLPRSKQEAAAPRMRSR
jgi:hypothetical protein